MEKEKKELAIANSIEVLKNFSRILRREGSIDECFGGWLSYYPSIKNPSFAVRNEYAAELKFVMEYLFDESSENGLNVANSTEILASLIRDLRRNCSLDESFSECVSADLSIEAPGRIFRDAYADELDLIIDFLKR